MKKNIIANDTKPKLIEYKQDIPFGRDNVVIIQSIVDDSLVNVIATRNIINETVKLK